MPDEPLWVRRKIGLERRYDGRQYAPDAFSRRQIAGFRHGKRKPKVTMMNSRELIVVGENRRGRGERRDQPWINADFHRFSGA